MFNWFFWCWSVCLLGHLASASTHKHISKFSLIKENLHLLKDGCQGDRCNKFILNFAKHQSHKDCKIKKLVNDGIDKVLNQLELEETIEHVAAPVVGSNDAGSVTESTHQVDQIDTINNDNLSNETDLVGKDYDDNIYDDYEADDVEWLKDWKPSSDSYPYPTKQYSSSSYTVDRCALPHDRDIVPVTPRYSNRGFAMSPDEVCTPGKYCPYACREGMYSAQWSPYSTCHTGPQCGSHLGGGYCNANGTLTKPFPDRPWCEPGIGNVRLVNHLRQPVSACQTVYPGNEAMLIPTVVHPSRDKVMNVPPNTYWFGTSAHYYLNPAPSTRRECRWGHHGTPVGNWSPYVLGMGQGGDGLTYISLNWNPEFKKDSPHVRGLVLGERTKQYFSRRNVDKSYQEDSYKNDYELYRVKIECGGSNECLGLPCAIDPNQGLEGGGCTVTLPKGSKAKFVVY